MMKVKNPHMFVDYMKLYIIVSWVNFKSAWNDEDL